MLELSVVIPFYNEADNILPLVQEVQSALEGHCNYELILVDDGSTDITLEKLHEARILLPERIHIIQHPDNRGQSASIVTGVSNAQASWIATLDGDGQNLPSDIPKLMQALDAPNRPAHLHMVCGNRRHTRKDNWLKLLSSRIANGVRSRILHDDTPDTGCGLKVFSREAFLDLPRFDHMHRFLPALIRRHGGTVISVPVQHRSRQHGQSKYGLHNRLWVGIVDMLGVMWLQRRRITDITDDHV